jgi:endonuclease/exonuclease/phosphatase family metal-dependent hydrolase
MKKIAYIILAIIPMLMTSCSDSEELCIMSYNIHHCRGMDNNIDYKRIAEVINRVSPHFVALQELDSATSRNNGKVCIEELGKETGMYASYASAIKFGGGSYGIGMLSKEKPLATSVVPLESSGEARRLLVVEFEKYVVACTHFPLKGDDREASARIVCDALRGYKKPLFLAGDMNCTTDTQEQKILGEYFTILNNSDECTYPSINPEECIDYIYCLKNGYGCTVKESSVLSGDSIASDHLPLYTTVELSY